MEGLPLSLLEAMSYGLPCIISDFKIPHIDEAVYLIDNNNPRNIADALENLINNIDLRLGLHVQSRRVINQHYSLEQMSNKYFILYQSTCR